MQGIQDLIPSDTPTAPEDLAVLNEPEKVETRPAAIASRQAAEPIQVSPPAVILRPSQLPKYYTNETAEVVTVKQADGTVREIKPGEVLVDEAGKPKAIDNMHAYRMERGIPNPLIRFRVTARKGPNVANPVECDAVDESDAVRQCVNELGIKYSHQWTFQVFVLER